MLQREFLAAGLDVSDKRVVFVLLDTIRILVQLVGPSLDPGYADETAQEVAFSTKIFTAVGIWLLCEVLGFAPSHVQAGSLYQEPWPENSWDVGRLDWRAQKIQLDSWLASISPPEPGMVAAQDQVMSESRRFHMRLNDDEILFRQYCFWFVTLRFVSKVLAIADMANLMSLVRPALRRMEIVARSGQAMWPHHGY